MAIFVKKKEKKRLTRQKVFPLPTVGAPSASNSPSALSARARLCISMAYNVITQNNQTIRKWLISLSNLSSRFPKSPEKQVASSRFTILLVGLSYIGSLLLGAIVLIGMKYEL